MDACGALAGRWVLLVEEWFLGQDLLLGLLSEGATVIGPMAPGLAAPALGATPRLDFAIVGLDAPDERGWLLVDALRARGVPFAVTTARAEREFGPAARARLGRARWHEKPFRATDVTAGAAAARA